MRRPSPVLRIAAAMLVAALIAPAAGRAADDKSGELPGPQKEREENISVEWIDREIPFSQEQLRYLASLKNHQPLATANKGDLR